MSGMEQGKMLLEAKMAYRDQVARRDGGYVVDEGSLAFVQVAATLAVAEELARQTDSFERAERGRRSVPVDVPLPDDCAVCGRLMPCPLHIGGRP